MFSLRSSSVFNLIKNTEKQNLLFSNTFIQNRLYTSHRFGYYFNKYYPPTGVPTSVENQEPWDYVNRPKKRQGQMAKRLEKLLLFNDYYTLFKQPEKEVVEKRKLTAPESRST